jgi:tetrahydromethanopterin S-methyltransferase subunit B
MVVVVPDPVVVIPPGVLVKVQLPAAGKPFNTKLPVETEQVGWVIVPMVGAVGEEGGAVIITSVDPVDKQPEALVTVKL